MSRDISKFMPYLTYPGGAPQTDYEINEINVVGNFDTGNDFYVG